MADIEHCDFTLYRYGNTWTTTPPGLGDYATSAAEQVDVVRASTHRGAVEALERVHSAVRRHFDAQGGHTPSLQAIEALSRPYAHGGR